MTLELQEAIEKCRTAILAAQCVVTEMTLYLEVLKEEADGWRRRNLILDSQIQRQEAAIARMEAIAAAWEAELAVITDLDWLDVQVRKLTGKILQEAAGNKKDLWESVS